jgi:hypothetical protein
MFIKNFAKYLKGEVVYAYEAYGAVKSSRVE